MDKLIKYFCLLSYLFEKEIMKTGTEKKPQKVIKFINGNSACLFNAAKDFLNSLKHFNY